MRISPEDRRLLNRRLKDRIPAAAKATMKRVPMLVLVVTTTLFVTPDAWARIQAGKAEPAFVINGTKPSQSSIFTKTYTKEELSQKMPGNPVITMDQRLMTEVTGVLNGIARNLKGSDQQAAIDNLRSREPTANEWALRVAAFGETEGDWSTQGPGNSKISGKKDAAPEAIRTFFAGESQKVASSTAKARTPIFSRFGQGLKWNFGLSSLFGKKETAPAQTAAAQGNVRYGLIVQDIKVDENAPKRAALSDSTDELQYAGHAEVQWTIGPMTEEHGRKVYTEESTTPDGRPTIGGIRLPSPNFRGAVTPENFDNLAKVDQANKPLMRFDVTQEQGYYNMAYRTELSGKRINVEHSFVAPVAGTVALGRRFNDNWDAIQTSAYNVLYDKRLPLLSVHFMNIEQRYKSDLSYNIKGHVVGLSGRGEAKGTVANEGDRPEAYSVNYTRDL